MIKSENCRYDQVKKLLSKKNPLLQRMDEKDEQWQVFELNDSYQLANC